MPEFVANQLTDNPLKPAYLNDLISLLFLKTQGHKPNIWRAIPNIQNSMHAIQMLNYKWIAAITLSI